MFTQFYSHFESFIVYIFSFVVNTSVELVLKCTNMFRMSVERQPCMK